MDAKLLGMAALAVVAGANQLLAQNWYPYPSFPVIITQPQITGMNGNGGLNTGNTMINNSAFDPFRHSSQFNGTMQNVNRPVYDQWGNVVGWRVGQQWRNSVTGQLHGNTQIIRPNGMGGMHTTNHAWSRQ